MSNTLYFEQPKLRNNVKIYDRGDYLHLTYHGNTVDIEPTKKVSLENIKYLLSLLNGQHTLEQLTSKIDFFTKDELVSFINDLDEFWFLTEGKKQEIVGKSGLEFILELEDKYAYLMNEGKETKLTQLILDNKASKNLIVGFTFEYYHVTRRCHECVSPAIAKAQGNIREQVLEFFLEEYRHDRLLLKSLLSLGYKQEEIENSIPLPYTQAIMNMLSKWAHTDLLSFMAGIFIYEGTDTDNIQYSEALSRYDFPEDFVKYQNTHGTINIEGEHGQVSREFFMNIPYISPEDQIRVINNIRMLNELHLRMHENTIDYYDRPDAVIPRSLDKLISGRN